MGLVDATRTAFLVADAFHSVHIQGCVLCISGDFPHSKKKELLNEPLYVSCDSDSLCDDAEREEKDASKKSLTSQSRVSRVQPSSPVFAEPAIIGAANPCSQH